jgi:hypothetical protein
MRKYEGEMGGGYDNEESVDEEEIEDVSTDLSSSSDEKSNNGGEDVDNADMRTWMWVDQEVAPMIR